MASTHLLYFTDDIDLESFGKKKKKKKKEALNLEELDEALPKEVRMRISVPSRCELIEATL